MYNTLDYQVDHGVATLTLNRPERLNALSLTLLEELRDALGQIRTNRAVRAVVLTGAGRAFSAGADLRDFPDLTPERVKEGLEQLYIPVVMGIRELPQPVIAAVGGMAVGAGVSLALACDLVLAAEEAVFSVAFTRIGLALDAGASWFLTRTVGPRRAMELALTGREIPAREAQQLGLINQVVPGSELGATVVDWARRLAVGPASLGPIKRQIHFAAGATLEEALRFEAETQMEAAGTADFREGVQAFLERRTPRFRGE